MSTRRHFEKGIKELEELFESEKDKISTLKALAHELDFRKRKRAATLKSRVQIAIKNLENDSAFPVESVRPNSPPPIDAKAINKQQTSTTEGSPTPREIPPEAMPPEPPTPRQPKPPITDDPQDILRAWTALEVLSPQGYRRETDLTGGDRSRIAQLDKTALPWEIGEKSRPKRRLYYELILGTINLGPAVEALLKVYADYRPDALSVNRKSPLASVLIDKEGRPLEEETSFAISSFAWGVPIALKGDLKLLADWKIQERELIREFRKRLIQRDEDGEIVPLTKSSITDLYSYLVGVLQLFGHDVAPPSFALRRYEFFASKVPPEPGLLNSFFLEDLASARELAKANRLPHALKHYLGVSTPANQTDLIQDGAGLQYLLQPALTSIARWPGKGRFPLALLQQAAVNATTKGLSETGVLSVNGPPGTGKTTLLRDVVAARVVERAIVMAGYENPATAFTATEQVLQRSGAKIALHRLDDRLKGFEMVVTSSNNKAVENVSAELPSMDAVADDAPNLRYFKSISDKVLERDTWGMIAAVLGNSSNRYQFSQIFWRDEENGLSTYLNHAVGIPQIVNEPQQDGPPIKRVRKVVENEQPPSSQGDALSNWKKAKALFEDVVEVARRTQAILQEFHIEVVRLSKMAAEIATSKAHLQNIEQQIQSIEAKLPQSFESIEQAENRLRIVSDALSAQNHIRPSFFARLFRTRSAQVWRRQYNEIFEQHQEADSDLKSRKNELENLEQKFADKASYLKRQNTHVEELQQQHQQLKEGLSTRCDKLSAPVPNIEFFEQTHEHIQTACVWFDQLQHHERDTVFEAAIALHRAFIDCAADPLRQNLSIFLESFGTRSIGTPQKDSIIPDLWTSFFLVVPVISTTFASVRRMFSRLEPETLGWLLVDEAGQAVPQAAVGAIMRSQRTVVVGDPLQIEPVVTLPNSLTEEVCGFFGVDPLGYNAPEASVQTVADRSSPYCARFPIGSGHRDVGAPLLVHRRCDSPMFDISNEIAYSNLMVQAKKPAGHTLPLGHSCWIDVVGKPGPDKWCEDEGHKLIELLKTLRSSVNEPDLYIVTPFVVVQDNLRRELLGSKVLEGWATNPDSWVWEHVGTVHTVQGREAETVFFVLGAQAPAQKGARAWAGGRPNLVNVAVTRAKSALYVIGNRELWKSAGVFATLDRHLPNEPQ